MIGDSKIVFIYLQEINTFNTHTNYINQAVKTLTSLEKINISKNYVLLNFLSNLLR